VSDELLQDVLGVGTWTRRHTAGAEASFTF
jgi:hypothetical protein